MGKIEYKQDKKKDVFEGKQYSARDFFLMEQEFKKYEIEKEFTLKGITKTISYVSQERFIQWLVDKKVAVLDSRSGCGYNITDLEKYRELRNKLDQYYGWQDRRTYAIKMSEKDYEGIAQEIGNEVEDLSNEMGEF